MLGVLAFKMPTDGIDAILDSRLGLGETGETFFVGADHLFRNDSAFSTANDVLATAYRHARGRRGARRPARQLPARSAAIAA